MSSEISTVYMIDDSDDEAYMTRTYFERQRVGPELEHFFQFAEFLAVAESAAGFDPVRSILIVDLNLRSARGTDVITEVRKTLWGAEMVVGICSGSEDPADRHSAIEAGADFFVGKPLDRVRLNQICQIDDRLEATLDGDQPLRIRRSATLSTEAT